MEPATARRATRVPAAATRPRGRPRKTADERDDGNRRRALILGAARLFRRKGFDATSTRDIAAAAGMQSGSPFYHFKSKQALLFAVMQEGMGHAVERQQQAIAAAGMESLDPARQLRVLVRHHFEVLLGPGSDFIPVMLYEARSITPRQRAVLAELRSTYEAAWTPVLEALRACGRLKADVKLARLMIFGALNWSVQWFDRRKEASLDELADAALALFIGESE
jgi:TetR/AcrR family transcriptional regulator, cholesterol catabolism regulator